MTDNILGNATMDFLSQQVKTSPFVGKVFIAGGFVRDRVLRHPSKDIDLVIASPNGGLEFANWITKKLGIHSPANPVVFERFGTAKFALRGVVHNGVDLSSMHIECVMTRKEKYTDGSRKPDVEFGTLVEDAERRDFTVNSLMFDLTTDEMIDPTGLGLRDIRTGVVQSTIDPNIIFREDPLRMLRAVRFAVRFQWMLPQAMIQAIRDNAHRIRSISAERIQDELCKILMTDRPMEGMLMLHATALTQYFLPEFDAMEFVPQNTFHKDDVLFHTMDVLGRTPRDLTVRLAALFHDIGKPETRTEVDGKVQFLRHEELGAQMVWQIMERLKFSNDMTHDVAFMVAEHMRLKGAGANGKGVSDKALRKFANDVGDLREPLLDLMHADNCAHAPEFCMPDQVPALRERFAALKAPVEKVTLPINGHDIMGELNIGPGPFIKELLELIREMVFENPTLTREEALLFVRRAYMRGALM